MAKWTLDNVMLCLNDVDTKIDTLCMALYGMEATRLRSLLGQFPITEHRIKGIENTLSDLANILARVKREVESIKNS